MRQSESLGNLIKALTAAQAEMTKAKKEASNPYFKTKYAPFESLIEASRPPLVANGLAVSQGADFKDGRVIVTTKLMHASGEWLESDVSIKPVKDDPQAVGSAITYGRRYGYQALICLAQADEDDDGNRATGKINHEAAKKNAFMKAATSAGCKDVAQIKAMFEDATKAGFSVNEYAQFIADYLETKK